MLLYLFRMSVIPLISFSPSFLFYNILSWISFKISSVCPLFYTVFNPHNSVPHSQIPVSVLPLKTPLPLTINITTSVKTNVNSFRQLDICDLYTLSHVDYLSYTEYLKMTLKVHSQTTRGTPTNLTRFTFRRRWEKTKNPCKVNFIPVSLIFLVQT